MDRMNLSLEEIIKRQQGSNSVMRRPDGSQPESSSDQKQRNNNRRRNGPKSNMGVRNPWKNGHFQRNRGNRAKKQCLNNSTLSLYEGRRTLEDFLGPPRPASAGGSVHDRASVTSYNSRDTCQSIRSVTTRGSSWSARQHLIPANSMSYHSQESLHDLQEEDNPNKFYVRLDATIQAHINLMRSTLEDRIASMSCPSLVTNPARCKPTSVKTDYSIHDRFSQFVINRNG